MEPAKKHDQKKEPDLRGTAFFVSVLGILMVLGVVGAFILFNVRGLTFLVS